MIAYPSNDQANLALVEGEIDWAGNFVPAIERTFVARDRAHHGYWYPPTGSTVFLYPNTQRAPLDDVRVRKALSLAIDRQRVVDIGLYGYARPSDGTGLSDAYAGWRDPAVAADGWVRHDARAAAALLDEAGWRRGADGVRHKDGRRLAFTLEVVSGWSDWVRAAQVIARDLGAVGVDVSLRAYEWSAWFQRLQAGEFELAIACPSLALVVRRADAVLRLPLDLVDDGARAVRSASCCRPTGTASATRAPTRCSASSSAPTTPRASTRSCAELEARFAATAPAIPLFSSPVWGVVQLAPLRRLSRRRTIPTPSCRRTGAGGPPRAHAPPAEDALMRYVLRRLALYAVAAWAAVTLGFVLPRLMPGDPATALLARLRGKLSPAALASMRDALGFADGSLAHQYVTYWRHLVHGDLGLSVAYFPVPVGEVIGTGLGGRSRSPAAPSSSASSSARCSARWPPGAAAASLDSVLPPLLALLGAVPYFWLAMVALFVFGYGAALVPARPRLQPRARAGVELRASPPTWCATPRCRR